MNVKKLLVTTVLGLFVVPALASAYTYEPGHYRGVSETLVEGHTVFAVIEANICVDEDNEKVPCPSAFEPSVDASYDVRANVTVQRLGAAVAVLVRDRVKTVTAPDAAPTCSSNKDLVATILYENPGVLWFNDQFLVGDDLDIIEAEADANVDVCAKLVEDKTVFNDPWSYPCGGWVWATQAGNPDPRTAGVQWIYEESYFITDPNDKAWIIDKFHPAPFGTLATALGQPDPMLDQAVGHEAAPVDEAEDNPDPLGDDDTGPTSYYDEDDDVDQDLRVVAGPAASNGAPLKYYLGQFNLWIVPVYDGAQINADGTTGTVDAGATARAAGGCAPYEDGAERDPQYHMYGIEEDTGAGVSAKIGKEPTPAVRYNAVLFFFFEDLKASGLKVHGQNATNDLDYSYCQAGTEWSCPSASATADAPGVDADGDGVADDLDGDGNPDDPAPVTVTRDLGDDAEGNSHPYNSESTNSGPKHVHLTAGVDLYFHNVLPPAVAERRYAVYDTVGSDAPRHGHDDGELFDDRVRIDPCLDADAFLALMYRTFNGGDYPSGWSEEEGVEQETEAAQWGDGGSDVAGANDDDCTSAGYGGGTTGSTGESY